MHFVCEPFTPADGDDADLGAAFTVKWPAGENFSLVVYVAEQVEKLRFAQATFCCGEEGLWAAFDEEELEDKLAETSSSTPSLEMLTDAFHYGLLLDSLDSVQWIFYCPSCGALEPRDYWARQESFSYSPAIKKFSSNTDTTVQFWCERFWKDPLIAILHKRVLQDDVVEALAAYFAKRLALSY